MLIGLLPACMYVGVRASETLELEFQTGVSCLVGAGNGTLFHGSGL